MNWNNQNFNNHYGDHGFDSIGHQTTLGARQSPVHVQQLGQINEREACTPYMACPRKRFETFRTWHNPLIAPVEELVDAGFFYLEGTKDSTKCFYCNGGLRNWERDDNPWIEHAKWYPNCSYLQMKKGLSFITQHNPKFKVQDYYIGPNIPPVTNTQTNFQNHNSNISRQIAVADSIKPPLPAMSLDSAMKTNAVQFVKNFGYEDDMIRAIIQAKLQAGENIESNQELLECCMEAEENGLDSVLSAYEMNTIPQQSTNAYSRDTGTFNQEPTPMLFNANNLQSDDIQPQAPTNADISDVNGQLIKSHEERICKVCLTNERNCFFLPCGHLCTCIECASALKTCPLCRVKLTEIRKVFF